MTKSDLVIVDSTLDQQEAKQAFINDLDRFLGPYSDPREEIAEALDNAMERGFVFEVRDGNDTRVGTVVITETPFRRFQPRYHLAYIAIAGECRGHGYGKVLLAEAQRRTGGGIALHVSPNNSNAIAFYERLGWKINYVRMMPETKP